MKTDRQEYLAPQAEVVEMCCGEAVLAGAGSGYETDGDVIGEGSGDYTGW